MENKEAAMALQEGYKAMVDTAKHLTTLCTASIVILATYLKDVFGGADQVQVWESLLPAVFLGFVVSLLLAAIVAYFVPLRLITPAYRRSREAIDASAAKESTDAPGKALYRLQGLEDALSISVFWCYRLSLVAFLVGIGLLAFFAYENLA
ncbi:hypothetical protein GBA63_09080 [Rubrobacter tropicus]|uniref:Uncharacterized protein n=1 Tax=Rubrobacter tropicus TaxID=2653851 RepID=A0A6G8Q8H1_9ACTN|nr:hypothetical protein [Rubrobacter tropicus]QIN82785.1 hypothetical protein GBA63_09080 [Rubrobacter tropicus]